MLDFRKNACNYVSVHIPVRYLHSQRRLQIKNAEAFLVCLLEILLELGFCKLKLCILVLGILILNGFCFLIWGSGETPCS